MTSIDMALGVGAGLAMIGAAAVGGWYAVDGMAKFSEWRFVDNRLPAGYQVVKDIENIPDAPGRTVVKWKNGYKISQELDGISYTFLKHDTAGFEKCYLSIKESETDLGYRSDLVCDGSLEGWEVAGKGRMTELEHQNMVSQYQNMLEILGVLEKIPTNENPDNNSHESDLVKLLEEYPELDTPVYRDAYLGQFA